MASEAEVAQLVQLGMDLTSFKLYVVCVTCLLAYDYLLTLKDEVRYAWKTENVLVFVLFLLTRYLPLLFHTWVVVAISYPGYTLEVCKKTAFLQVMNYTFIAAFSQIVLTLRAYAITKKNKWVAGILYAISIAQFGVGVSMFVGAIHQSVDFPAIPFDSYHMCLAKTTQAFTIIQMTLSLVFDIAIFVLIIAQTQLIKARRRGVNMSSILDTISRDAEVYFAVITTCHFLIVVMFAAARPGIRSLPIVGNAAFMPMMISRMIISLKKVANTRQHMSMELPARLPMVPQGTHSRSVDGIQLSVLRDQRV